MADLITTLTNISPVLIAIITVIPGVIALLLQRRNEQDKLKKERTEFNVKTVTDKKIRDAEVAKQVQDIYQEIIEDLKLQTSECKNEIHILAERISAFSKQNAELIRQNEELTKEIESLKRVIQGLKEKLDNYEKENGNALRS